MDEVIENPQIRTQKVLEVIMKNGIVFDNWTLICFCILYLSSQLSVVPDVKDNVESLAKTLLYAHYFNGGDFGLYDEAAIQRLTTLKVEAEISKTV